jgi:hypothetical protein
MPWFKKIPDPISNRARALNHEIARLESQIKKLDGQLQRNQDQPRLRSTALPNAASAGRPSASGSSPAMLRSHDPVFEEVDQDRLQSSGDVPTTERHYNDLGVRKYDLPALLMRLRNHFRGPSTTNPKLVSYLAAGGLQGLRPLRYEKRVARNRFLALVVILFLVLLGIILGVMRHR